ncbi:hypothetical protein OG349_27660 [Streptomyces sp. NBC_01317]|uniref:hypothetical protein n=1 Tax=Streptomyces sp. NBC_01317 TaxID=2903822 RepID=UPI002E1198A7|nr:hypothetical protein OG349_27660 [Streptomyces sp. NBC_01317]
MACAAYGPAALVVGVAVGIAVAGAGLSTVGDLNAEWTGPPGRWSRCAVSAPSPWWRCRRRPR